MDKRIAYFISPYGFGHAARGSAVMAALREMDTGFHFEIFTTVPIRKSSSYYESLIALNKKLKKDGKNKIRIIPADENLEDEDLLEMVNASLIPMIVMDSHKAAFWQKIFPDIKVR